MRQIVIILFLCLPLISCERNGVLKFFTEDDSIVGDDLPYTNTQPVIQTNRTSFYVPFKPVQASNLYASAGYADIMKKPIVGKYAQNIFYKPETYWYSGARKNKVLAKAKAIGNKNKREFVSKIGLKIAETNEKIAKQKEALSLLSQKIYLGYNISSRESSWLKELAGIYKLDGFNPKDKKALSELNTRVDVVPESLAIAQAAVESAWGKSRFAKHGNNYFGQWCFEKGCGMVPKARDEGKIHEVKVFKNPSEAVEAYIHNLNTNSAYKNFRVARSNMGSRISGLKLASYLDRYSAKGSKYGKIVKEIIIKNNLE